MAYSQKVQDILSDYGTGALTAAKAKKALKEQGYGADFREAPTGEIFVYEINLGPDEEGEGDFYNFAEGGIVNIESKSKVDLGAASPDFSGMSMNEAFGLEPGDEGYMGLFPGPVYKEGDVIDDDPYRDAVEFERSADRVSPYEGFAETRSTMTDMEFFPSLIDGKLFQNSVYGKTGRHVPIRPQLEADGSVTVVPLGFQEGGEPSREQAFAVAESSKRENAIQMLNALSEEELIEQFGLQGYQRLLADAGILDFGSIQIQPQIDAAASGLEATSELGPFDLLQQQQRGQGRLGFAADVDDFGTFGAGVTVVL